MPIAVVLGVLGLPLFVAAAAVATSAVLGARNRSKEVPGNFLRALGGQVQWQVVGGVVGLAVLAVASVVLVATAPRWWPAVKRAGGVAWRALSIVL